MMHDQGRSRRRRRTAGLTMVRSWTRWSVAAGVALSAVLSAGLGYVLPGHAANTTAPRRGATTSTSRPAPTGTPTGHGHAHHHHHKRHRLTPPAATPRPAPPQTRAPQRLTQQPAQPPATSGGS